MAFLQIAATAGIRQNVSFPFIRDPSKQGLDGVIAGAFGVKESAGPNKNTVTRKIQFSTNLGTSGE